MSGSNGYSDRARDAREGSVRPPEGEYGVRFKGWEFKYSKPQPATPGKPAQPAKPMFVVDWKPVSSNLGLEVIDKLTRMKKVIRCRYILTVNHHFDNLLALLEDMGADLSALPALETDPDFLGFRGLFDQLEKRPPDAKIKLFHNKDNTQYYDIKMVSVEKVLGTALAVATTTTPLPIPAATLAYVPPAPTVVVEVPQFTLEQLRAAGWPDSAIQAQYPHLMPVAAVPAVLPPPPPVAAVVPPAPPVAASAPVPAPAGGPPVW